SCFPPIAYIHLLLTSKPSIIDLGEHYVKQRYFNRYKLAGPNGVETLIVPVQNTHQKTPVKDIKISYSNNWQKIHLRTIETIYNKSPYYIHYKDVITKIFHIEHKFLIDLNNYVLDNILKLANINFNPIFSFQYIESEDIIDLRDAFNPKKIDISKTLIFPEYYQVFSYKSGFIPNMSFLDILLNIGPDVFKYLMTIKKI
ncbi:MAG TPA: WbqC family protein, partial [Bacteroidales bacterium]|nr:WbqC family protein [Bacteroidales bacterium]